MAIKQVKRLIDGKLQKVWVYDFRMAGRRVRTPRGSCFPTRDECQDAADAIRADYRRGIYRFPADAATATLGQIRDDWIKRLKRRNAHQTTIRRAERAFEHLGSIIPLSSGVTKLNEKHLARYVEAREQIGIKPQTIFAELGPVLAALKSATTQHEELKDWRPPGSPDHIKGKRSSRQRVITQEEEIAIVAELRRELTGSEARYKEVRGQTADVFEMGLMTGMRLGEILSLRWDDVNFDRSPGYPHGWILVRATKTGDRATGSTDDRVVPVAPGLTVLLGRRKKSTSSEWLFPAHGTRKSKLGHQTQMFWALMKACERAGVRYGKFVPGGMVFHDTRHTAVTRMLQAGIDLKTVMDIAGHRSSSTTLIYAHSTARSKYQAVEAMDRTLSLASALSPPNTTNETHSDQSDQQHKSG